MTMKTLQLMQSPTSTTQLLNSTWTNTNRPSQPIKQIHLTSTVSSRRRPNILTIVNSSAEPPKPAAAAANFPAGIHQTAEPEEERKFRKLLQSKEKVAKLRFYLQDALGGYSSTVWEVARSRMTASSAESFGLVRVVDDLITTEPDRNSEKMGRAQGMISFTGLEESALTMNLNFYFTAGEFSGSTLCVVGRNPISRRDRELPVVGGTGVFRMARGYTISNTYSYDAATNYGVLEYTVYVAYYEE